MTEPVKNGNKVVKPQQQTVSKEQTPQKLKKNDSTLSDILSKGAAIVMLPIVATASVIYLGGKSVEGAVTSKPYDQAMTEGLRDIKPGADMIERMWDGKYF